MPINWSNVGESAVTGGLQAAGNGLLGLAGSALNYRYNKKLMSQQNQYNIEAFNRENERQDWLLQHQAELFKQGMHNAGISAANMGADGIPGLSVNNMDVPSNPGAGQADLGKLDLLQARLVEAQAENIEADTEKKVKETEGQSIDNYLKSNYGDAQWQAAIKNLDSQTAQNIANEAYLTQKKVNETNLTDAQVDSIEKHLDWDYQKLDPELKLLAAQAYEATKSGDLSHTEISQVWQNIKESAQRVENLKKELGLTDAQITVATNLANNYAKENNILGYQTTSAKAQAELDQFNRDLTKSMGLRFYKAKRVSETVLPIGATAAVLGKAFGLGK